MRAWQKDKSARALNRLFQLVPQGTLGNRYRLDQCLGDGTYGFVWKAERLEDHQIVALKIPKEQGGKNSDLEEGKRLIGAPSHPNVIQVFSMGRIEGEVYAIEMEYFNSHTLAFLLDGRDERLVASYKYVLSLYEQVLDGVCHLHSLKLTHGDIKPQNILVQGDLVKLTDFGSSLTTQDFYVRSRENGGTILYSPPEFAGLTTRKRSGQLAISHDVYSLGVLLYQLLTGQLPHNTLAQVVRHTPFPKPREISKSIAPELEQVVLKALELEPLDRWVSVDEMRQAFKRAFAAQMSYRMEREPIIAAPPTTDWSTQVLDLMDEQAWSDAEAAARAEFQRSQDGHAFLLMLRAAIRDERYFDALQILEASPQMLEAEAPVIGDVEQLALKAYIKTERIREALDMVGRCIQRQGELPGLLLRKASLLGVQARYKEAAELLMKLNRLLPRRYAILKRLVMVFEQMRDWEKAVSFKRVLSKLDVKFENRRSYQ
jgi:serine/threonine-protein kinase